MYRTLSLIEKRFGKVAAKHRQQFSTGRKVGVIAIATKHVFY
jgi:hypothetical protein